MWRERSETAKNINLEKLSPILLGITFAILSKMNKISPKMLAIQDSLVYKNLVML